MRYRIVALLVASFAPFLWGCSNVDKEAEKSIVGVWSLASDSLLIQFNGDHTGSALVERPIPLRWSIKDGALTTTDEEGKNALSAKVLSVDDKTLVLRRESGTDVFDRSSKAAYDAKSGVAKGRSSQADTAISQAARPPEVQTPAEPPIFDENYYVPEKHVLRLEFVLNRTATVQLAVDAEGPLDLVVLPSDVALDDYTNLSQHIQSGGLNEVLNNILQTKSQPLKIEPTQEAVFASPLSKRGAYGHYQRTASLPAGRYAIFLDNLGTFTPSRGDVGLKLQLLAH